MSFSGYCPRFICSPDLFTSVFFPVQLFCCPAMLLRISAHYLGQAVPGSQPACSRAARSVSCQKLPVKASA